MSRFLTKIVNQQPGEKKEVPPGVGSSSAQGKSPAQGNISTQGIDPAPGSTPAPTTQGRRSAQGKVKARGRLHAQGRVTAQPGVAPQRDFTKSANSIVREALRDGLFRGKSKQIYDFLYSKTRGAVVPSRSAQLTRAEIMRGAHLGSTHTLRDNLHHLRSVGLVSWEEKAGEQEGNLYFVHLPEEAHLPFDLEGNPVQFTSPDYPGHSEQNVPRPLRAESAQGAQGLSVEDSTSSESPKTSFKTVNTVDDERDAFKKMTEILIHENYILTDKFPTGADQKAWAEVAEVIVEELRQAASKTKGVSSVPAFLAEHLRRRLARRPPRQGEGKQAPAVEAPRQPELDPDRRLTHEEITSYAATVTDLLKDGATFEDVTSQFAGSLHPNDWSAIRESAALQIEQKES